LARSSVVNLSGGVAAASACRLLADTGAEVVTARRDDDPLAPAGRRAAVGRFLHLATTPTDLATARAAAVDADVVVIGGDEVGRAHRTPARPSQIVVAITAFGLDGPAAARPSSDLVLQAESGGLATRGRPGSPPFMAGGGTIEWVSGAYAAAAAIAAGRNVRRTGCGEVIDVSMLEVAHVTTATYAPLMWRLNGCPPIERPARSIESPEIHPTRDGWVGFTTNSGQQFRDFLVMIERDDLLDDEALAAMVGRQARYEEFTAIVEAWTRAHTTDEIVELAAAFRIPCAPVLDAKGVLDLPFFASRKVFERTTPGDLLVPRRPWRIDDHDPPPRDRPAPVPTAAAGGRETASADDRLPLAGVRVVDMTAWWAGPTATHLLACLGADVIHVESPTRPDGMRMTAGGLRHLPSWWERAAFFLSVNANKRGLAVDLTRADGMEVLHRLLATADLLVENFTPRVLDNLGLGWPSLHERHQRLSLVRMPAYGSDGPWRDRPGFAQTMEQLSGLAWLTGLVPDQPHNQRGPCDPNGGVHAALAAMCALDLRDADGEGHLLEVPFIEVALNAASEAIVECAATGSVAARAGNRSPHAAPQGLYACRGEEQWLALSVESDEQWQALRRALGQPDWACDVALDDHAGRAAHHDRIDGELERWAARFEVEAAVELLVRHGVPAGVARDPRRSDEHEQMRARGFFETIEHPVVGAQPTVSLPFRFSSVEAWLRTPAPTLGEHNEELLEELGFDDAQRAALAAAGVVGTVPIGL
jgi:crotonobetainyl-CoA:carnitine CoA-transferase CaiB-like acyl-CoA transferase